MISTNELVEWYLVESRDWRQRDQGHTRTGWRASSLGNCLRKQTYARLGIPAFREFDAATLRTFSYGDLIHDWVKRFFRDSGVLLAEEGKLTAPELDLAGHFDVLLGCVDGRPADITDAQRERWSPYWVEHIEHMRDELAKLLPGDDEVVIGEIKSISPYGFKYVRSDGPKPEHQLQLGGYFVMSEADPSPLPAVPTTGRLIYVSKDSKEKILDYEYEEGWAVAARSVVDELNTYWRAGELPPCTCEGWQVGYCDYLKPEARLANGKASKLAVAGKHCCPPELFDTAMAEKEED